jgi:hypothetical protein
MQFMNLAITQRLWSLRVDWSQNLASAGTHGTQIHLGTMLVWSLYLEVTIWSPISAALMRYIISLLKKHVLDSNQSPSIRSYKMVQSDPNLQ